MRFFSVDSPLYRFLCRLWDILQVNFLFLIGCIPVITIGASAAGAFKVCLHMVDEEEGYIWKEYVKGFKENWKQGTVLELLTLFCIYVVYLDLQFFHAIDDNPVIFLIIAMVSGFFFFICLVYTYPLIARYQNSIMNTLRNSFRISRKYFGRTLMMLALVALEVLLWMFNTTTLFIGFLIGPGCIIFTIAGIALRIFQEIETDQKSESEET